MPSFSDLLDRSFFQRTSRAAALLLLSSAVAGAAPSAAPVVIAGPHAARLRVEAVDPHVVRLWYKAGGEFVRPVSDALQGMTPATAPLTLTDDGGRAVVSTGALTVRIDRTTLAFDVTAGPRGVPLLAGAGIAASNAPANASAWSLHAGLAPEEHLFGLGQDNRNHGRLDRRGVIRDLWAGQQINSGDVTAQYPVPLLLSSGRDGHAYGVFLDNVHHQRFDLGHTQADRWQVDADGGEIDLYVIDGPRLADVIERYTGLTGRPSLPPLWALGYWQSKCQYNDWDDLDGAFRELTARGFPVDVMVIDAGWPEFISNYTWAKRWGADATGHGLTPAQKIAGYAAQGVRIVVSQSGPMVQTQSPTFADGWARGVFATDGQGHPVECGYYGGKLLDFTHPEINDWLWPQTRRVNEAGVAGWWLDLTEPEGEPPQTHYHAGRPPEIHNAFANLCAESFEGVQLAVHPERRPFILSRSGAAGLQRHHAAVWTGDIYSDYATLRAHPPEMLNSGLSGFAWWTCDTGGFLTGYYKDDQTGAHARLYERWMQFSVFSPIVRTHKAGGSPEPYQFGPAVEQSARHYLQLRYRLLPYLYSYAWEASRKGLPLVRPLALEYPDDPRAVATPGDQYLFGRELLVAPVLREGRSTRTVYFPAGTWIDWDNGYDYAGGREWVVAAPQNRIPVAVRAGAIIPLAPDMKNTAEKPWDPLTLEIFPAGRSEFTLYRDDGVTFDYRRGAFTLTRFASEESGARIRFTVAESDKRFTPQTYRARFHLRRTPRAVTLDGTPCGRDAWSWDAAARVLEIGFADGDSTRHVLELSLADRELPARLAPELTEDPVDPQGEATGAAGRPLPHFFPPPALPATIRASNYDKGGEGVAFHSTRPAPEKKLYREDDIGLVATGDTGGGCVPAGLRAGEWLRYTIDCGNGGWFDVTVRAASAAGGGRLRLIALDRTLASLEVPATGGADTFRDFTFPAVYLNPGELSLMAYVDAPGVAFNTIALRASATTPAIYPAALALRRGVTEHVGVGEPAHPLGYVRNLGRTGGSLTFGIVAAAPGPQTLRLRYQSTYQKPVALSLAVGDGPAQPLAMASTDGVWTDVDLPVTLQAGANRVVLAGQEPEWNSVAVESLTLIR